MFMSLLRFIIIFSFDFRYDKALLLAATGSGDIDFATAMEVVSEKS